MDGHCQHVESAQQRRGGRAGRDAVRRGRKRRHQLPELGGAVQPQDQHLGSSFTHEHTQVSLKQRVHIGGNSTVKLVPSHFQNSSSMIRNEVNTCSVFYFEWVVSVTTDTTSAGINEIKPLTYTDQA